MHPMGMTPLHPAVVLCYILLKVTLHFSTCVCVCWFKGSEGHVWEPREEDIFYPDALVCLSLRVQRKMQAGLVFASDVLLEMEVGLWL